MVTIEVFSGAAAFCFPEVTATILAVIEGKRPSRPESRAFTDDLWELVQRCWAQEPDQRPKATDALVVFRDLLVPHPFLERLRQLDKSSHEFGNQLTDVLYGEEYKQHGPNLQGADLVWLVDYLDKVLDDLYPTGTAFRKCLRELRRICGDRGILPQSHMLSPHALKIDANPSTGDGFGDMYHGTLNGSRVCIKRVRVYTGNHPQATTGAPCKEVVMWKRLKHPNIVPLLGVTLKPFQVISDWIPCGWLQEYITKNSAANRLRLISNVVSGLYYLHSCNTIHGGLKGPVVLVDDSGHARISDFGFATIAQNPESGGSVEFQRGLTPRWTAPELLEGGVHSREADIFSFAMVMIEAFTCADPFDGDSDFQAITSIAEGNRPPRPTHPAFTEDLWVLTQRCWDQNPQLRPEAHQVLQILIDALQA